MLVTFVYIMICTVAIVVGLVWWALLLMEQALRWQDFSRMLAGVLVATAATGVLAVHFFMSDYIAFLRVADELAQQSEWLVELSPPPNL